MLTTAQYDLLRPDLVLAGVWDTIVKESPITQRLPMKTVNNEIIKYNLELTMPTVSWLQPGDLIPENTGTIEQRTTNLYELIGDADTDKFKIATNPLQNPESLDISAKAKAMAHAFELAFIMGQTTTASSSKEFKGLMRILAEFESASTTDLDGLNNSQVIPGHATSAALTMAMLDELVDAVKPGKPDCLLMSRRMNRKVTSLQRASGSGVVMIKSEEFGLTMPGYDGIPIYESDWLPDNIQDGASSVLAVANYNQATARASGYDNSIIFALKIGEEDVTGLQARVITHERETFVSNKNVIRNRFAWYPSLMCKKKFSLAALINVLDTAL